MSTTRYKIRLWEYDGEASVANAVTFDSFAEAEARFNDLRVSEEMPCVEFIKERIANGCIIGDEVLMPMPRSCAATSNEQRVRVEVFSKISATFLPRSVSCGMPALFLAFSSAARSSR